MKKNSKYRVRRNSPKDVIDDGHGYKTSSGYVGFGEYYDNGNLKVKSKDPDGYSFDTGLVDTSGNKPRKKLYNRRDDYYKKQVLPKMEAERKAKEREEVGISESEYEKATKGMNAVEKRRYDKQIHDQRTGENINAFAFVAENEKKAAEARAARENEEVEDIPIERDPRMTPPSFTARTEDGRFITISNPIFFEEPGHRHEAIRIFPPYIPMHLLGNYIDPE